MDQTTCPTCKKNNTQEAKFCNGCGAELKRESTSFDGFISYRRKGGGDRARLVQMKVESITGKKLFIDVDELRTGPFDSNLLQFIEQTPNFIAILTEGSLDRCKNEGDWFGREIMHAIKTRRNIIPVMNEGFEFPTGSKLRSLPQGFIELFRQNAVTWSHANYNDSIRKIALFMKDTPITSPLDIDQKEPARQVKTEEIPAVLTTKIETIAHSVPNKKTTPPDIAKKNPTLPNPVSGKRTSKSRIITITAIIIVIAIIQVLVLSRPKAKKQVILPENRDSTIQIQTQPPETSFARDIQIAEKLTASGYINEAKMVLSEIIKIDSANTAAIALLEKISSSIATPIAPPKETVKDPNIAYLKAEAYERSNPSLAAQMFEKNTIDFPRDHRNFLKAGVYYSAQKSTAAKGVKYLEKCVGLVDTIPQVWFDLGWLYASMNRKQEMLNAFRKYITLDQQDIGKILAIGETLLVHKLVDDAMVFLEMAGSIRDNDIKVMTLLARGYLMTNRREEGAKIIEKVARLAKGNIDDDLRSVLIDVYLENKQTREAITEINTLLAKKRTNPLLLKYAKALLATGMFPEATSAIEDIKATEPHNIEAIMILGKIQFSQKKYDEAVESYKDALYINQYYAPAMIERANVYLIQGKLQWAKTFYERALNVDSNLASAHFGLAIVADMSNDDKTYQTELLTASRLDPNNKAIKSEIEKANARIVATEPPPKIPDVVGNAVIEGIQISTEAGATADEKIITCYFIFADKPSSYFYESRKKEKKIIFEFNGVEMPDHPIAKTSEMPIKSFTVELRKINVNKEVKGLNPEWHDQVRVIFNLEAVPRIMVKDEYNIISFSFKWSNDPKKMKKYLEK